MLKSKLNFNSLPEDDFEIKGSGPLLDGFEQLWQADENSFPQDYRSNLEKLLEEQQEEILYLTDALNVAMQENLALKQELSNFNREKEVYQRVCSDYASVLELNRALTKQLNSLMYKREKEKQQIMALTKLFA